MPILEWNWMWVYMVTNYLVQANYPIVIPYSKVCYFIVPSYVETLAGSILSFGNTK